MTTWCRACTCACVILGLTACLPAQQPPAQDPGPKQSTIEPPAKEQKLPEVRAVRLAENVYMLSGAGGNLALLAGDDGAVLIDSEYTAMHDKLVAALKETTKAPIRYVVNTHWHFDHVEGNEAFSKAGACIVAHENVRKKMSAEQHLDHIDRTVPPSPAAALPTITYTDAMTLYLDGEEVRIIHVEPAHTDGDSFILFRKANVLHVGDTFFNGEYPFIDVRAGGSLDGLIKAAARALELADQHTKIIPGHGPQSTKAGLQAYHDMLVTARDRIGALVKQGKSRDEVIAAKPTQELDPKWAGQAFPPDMWVGIVYDAMVRK